MAIILPGEGDLPLVDIQEAVIGDGHAMGIATHVVEDLFRAPKGGFGADHPVGLAKRGQILGESMSVTQSLQEGKEVQLALVKSRLQVIEEQASEEARQHPDRQKEARAAGDPTLTVRGEATARHHTMQMGMMSPARTIP